MTGLSGPKLLRHVSDNDPGVSKGLSTSLCFALHFVLSCFASLFPPFSMFVCCSHRCFVCLASMTSRNGANDAKFNIETTQNLHT